MTLLFSILGTILILMLIADIDSMNGIFAASVCQNIFITFKYAYFTLIISIVSVIGSILYTIAIISFSVKRVAHSKEQRKFTKKKAVSEVPIEEKQKLPEPEETLEKQPKVEKTLLPEISHEYESDEEPKPVTKPEESPPQKKYFEFDKEKTKRIDSKEELPKTEISKELPKSPLFEKALDSAIEKRHPEAEKEHVEEKKEEPPAKKKINIRCPQCKNVFSVEKGEGPTNIECPNCGKKGVID